MSATISFEPDAFQHILPVLPLSWIRGGLRVIGSVAACIPSSMESGQRNTPDVGRAFAAEPVHGFEQVLMSWEHCAHR